MKPVAGQITPEQDARWFESKAAALGEDDPCPCELRAYPCRECDREAGSASVALFFYAVLAGAFALLVLLPLGEDAVCAMNGDAGPHYCSEEAR